MIQGSPRSVPHEYLPWRGHSGSSIWLPSFSACCRFVRPRDENDEKHVHPLQLDAIERCLVLWSNPGERVFDPFAGVGSTVYAAVQNGRLGLGVELKPSYYHQMVKNMRAVDSDLMGQTVLAVESPVPA